MDVPGDMDIGVAAGPVSLAAAGEPSVLSIWLCLIIQPDLKPLDVAVPVAERHQKPRMAENVPISPVNIEARDTLQIVKVGKDARQKTPGGAGHGQSAVHVLLNTLLTQSPSQKIGFVLGGELQVHEHIIVDIVPDGQGAGLPFRRFL